MSKKRSYMFTDRKHSLRAIMGTILGIISLISLIIVVILSVGKDGEISAGYGFTGFFATLYSIVGVALGVLTIKEKDYFKLFPRLAVIINGIDLAFISLILYFGNAR